MDLKFLVFAEKRKDSAISQMRGDSRVYKEGKGSFHVTAGNIFGVSYVIVCCRYLKKKALAGVAQWIGRL